MTAYVIDASALVLALNDKASAADTLRERLPDIRLHAQHLIDAEVGNLSFYDALYVALAARLGVPLVTADARLSVSLPCERLLPRLAAPIPSVMFRLRGQPR